MSTTELTREQRMAEADKAFQEEKEKRAKQKVEDANKKEGRGNWEEKEYVVLEYEKTRIVRLLGKGKLSRNGNPFAAKEILISKIVGDDGKQFRCIWPTKEENPAWPMWKMYNKVMAYKWDKTLNGGKGGPIYTNSDSPLFPRVDKNGKIGNKNERGWKPQAMVMINCLDRENMDWHRKEKHTKLLSKKGTINDKGEMTFPEEGIPVTFYNNIVDNIVAHYGSWENYDIALKKTKTGSKDSDVAYLAIHCEKHIEEVDEDVRKYIVPGYLTDEEYSWEMYNIDKMSQVTSYQKLLKHLKLFIQQYDEIYKEHIFDEITALAEKEKKEWEVKKEEPKVEVTKPDESPKVETETKTEEPKKIEEDSREEELPTTKLNEALEKKFDVETLDKTIYKGIKYLSEKEKKMIAGIDSEKSDGSLKYEDELGQKIQALKCLDKSNCSFGSPKAFNTCPKCGFDFINKKAR
jgi:hypothetical protein